MAPRDEPWLMRTYSGHSTARKSNELYRTNLAKGQTGLSIAFDLPTQTGYDPDSPMARGEVGKVGVPVTHLGHMRTLLDGIPPATMNTSMTINATAPWLLALYVANAAEQGAATAGQVTALAEDLIATSRRNRESLAVLVRHEVEQAVKRLGLAPAGDTEALTRRVRELERTVRELKAASRPAKKAAPAKKTGGGKGGGS
jgi:methylmalonyl-CoA mutase N-terminal domain/subunit